jgi:hypothetical protein
LELIDEKEWSMPLLLAQGGVIEQYVVTQNSGWHPVNRLVYGERDNPYAVLSRLGRHMEATLAPETVLPTIVETIARLLKLPYVAIVLRQEETLTVAAAYGAPAELQQRFPLVYQAEPLGALVLSPRAPRWPIRCFPTWPSGALPHIK